MTRPDRQGLLRYALEARWRRDDATSECLDDYTLAAFAERSLDDGARAGAVSHLAGCPSCRSAVASVTRVLTDPSVAREIAGLDRPAMRRFARVAQVAVPLAAAAILVVVVWPEGANDVSPVHRAPTLTAAPSPAPMWPVGTVSDARTLRWAAVSDADRYRVTLFDAVGDVRYEVELTGTAARLPDSVSLVPGQPYLWKVDARVGFDRWAASDLVEFSIGGGTPR